MSDSRHLKIFISSTFQDMEEEREILLKKTFLELKKIAKSRDVEITEIDLRTGVAKEQAESGEVIKICLDEIKRCSNSPIFFLGILGNRYGNVNWIDDVSDRILKDKKYSWITDFSDRSITEIEIISALERDKNHNRAFIYLKEGKDDTPKLTELKNRLITKSKKSQNIEVLHYKESSDFREKTIESFTKALDELYPKDEKISEVEKLRSSHQIFAKSRQKIYITHAKNESILSEFIASEQDRLLLYGESGYGKSALIANYFEEFKKSSNSFVIEHYIGGAGELSNDLHQMLRRIMLEIKEEFELSDEVPTEPQKIMDEFALWLHRVKRQTIIVFDGYNQIEDEMKEKLFYYIPEKLESVKLIISSIKDNYPIENKYKIEPLTKEEQKELIVDYLTEYGKEGMALKIQNQITKHPQTDNTLFLRTLLNEIRLLGDFDNVEKDIDNYLQAKDVVELFIKIFERLESDYRENLAKEVLSLLYVSRDGLSEDNLMEIINQNSTKKLTRLEFSPLFLAVEEHLIDRGGLYGFFHGFILEAVKKRYLSNDELVNVERRKIADYFERRDIDNQRVRELPFQLFEIGDIDRLYLNLLNIEFFFRLIDNEGLLNDILRYVSFIDEKYDIIKSVLPDFLRSQNVNQISRMALFLSLHYIKDEEALLLYKRSLKLQLDLFGDRDVVTTQSYINLAQFYCSIHKYDKALYLYKKAINIRKDKLGIKNIETIESINYLIRLYIEIDEFEKALKLQKNNINNLIKLLGKNNIEYILSLNALGVIYSSIGEYNKALNVHTRNLTIYKKLYKRNNVELIQIYTNLSSTLYELSEYTKSKYYLDKALNLCLNIYGKNHPDTLIVYKLLANLLLNMHQIAESKKIIKYVIYFEKKLNNSKCSILTTYYILEDIYFKEQKYNLSLLYHFKSLKIAIKCFGYKSITTAENYFKLGNYFLEISNFNKAIYNFTKALSIYTSLSTTILSFMYNKKTFLIYNSIGLCNFKLNNYQEALIYYKKSLKVLQKNMEQYPLYISTIYNNMAKLYVVQKEYKKAFPLYKKALEIGDKFNIDNGILAKFHSNFGTYYFETKNYKKAKEHYLKTIELLSVLFPDGHPEIDIVYKDLEKVNKKLNL